MGLSGVSYLTSSQWTIAATRPPHLAAINPWEGWSDTYREVARHGGIPETYFWPYIGERWGYGTGRVEDLAAETAAHPLFDDFWASKAAPLEPDHRAGLRGRELVGPGPAHPGHVRGVRPDRLGAQMAGRARREEMGLLLQRRRPAAPAGVLRPLPAGPGHRDQRLAAGALPGPGARAPRGPGRPRPTGPCPARPTSRCTWTPPRARCPGPGPPRPPRCPTTANGPGAAAAGPRSTSASTPPPSWSAA